MQATEIKQDAATSANAFNADVISAAFKRANVSCPNCDFPKNCGEFRSLLYDYTDAKIQLHRINRLERWSWERLNHWTGALPSAKQRIALEQTENYSRDLLRAIWPCQDCIERFNPTGKIKYPNFNAPKGKDFLE